MYDDFNEGGLDWLLTSLKEVLLMKRRLRNSYQMQAMSYCRQDLYTVKTKRETRRCKCMRGKTEDSFYYNLGWDAKVISSCFRTWIVTKQFLRVMQMWRPSEVRHDDLYQVVLSTYLQYPIRRSTPRFLVDDLSPCSPQQHFSLEPDAADRSKYHLNNLQKVNVKPIANWYQLILRGANYAMAVQFIVSVGGVHW